MTESFIPEDKKDFGKPKPQQDFPKTTSKPLIALKSCVVQLPGCDCEVRLVKGCEVHGLNRAERGHLKFHKLAE